MRTTLRIGIACAALLLMPAAAQAGFTPDVLRVSGDFGQSLLPRTAVNAEGATLIAWREPGLAGSLLRVRRVRPDGSLGQTATVSDGTMIPVQWEMAFAAGGRALIVWTESVNGTAPLFVRGRWVEADDSLGAQITLRNAGIAASGESPIVAGTTDGDAVAAWRNSASAPIYQVEAREVAASGATGPLLQPPDGPGQTTVAVAPNSAGGALVAWTGAPAIKAMPVDAAGAAGAVQTPVAAGVIATPRLTTDGAGRFHILWQPIGEPDQLATLALDAAGVATGARQSVESGVGLAAFPQMATNSSNRSLAVWSRDQTTAVARAIGASGVPEAATVSAPAEVQFSQDVALLDDGTGILLWSQGPLGNVSQLWARVIGPDGAPAGPQLMAPSVASFGTLAISPGGIGLAAWEQRDPASAPRFVAARQHLPPPACPDASATVVQGRPTTVALTCSGPQLTAPQVLSAPANGTVSAVDPATSSVVYTPRPGFQGVDAFTFWGTNRGGVGPVRTARVTVGKDTVAPVVRRFALNRTRVRLATAFRARAKRKPAFALRVSEPATARITIQRRVGKRFRTLGRLSLTRAATTASVRLVRQFGKRRLAPGSYRAAVVATDLALNRSAPKRVRFRVTLR